MSVQSTALTLAAALAADFEDALRDVGPVLRAGLPYPARFIQVVNRLGGVGAARFFIAQNWPQAGLNALWECGRLDLSMEAIMLEPRYRPLFTAGEITAARQRLRDYGYPPVVTGAL